MNMYLALTLGGSIGAILRFQISNAVYALLGRGFPYGTLSVNLIGSLLMGMLLIYFQTRTELSEFWRVLLMVGLLGSLTTFSTFSLDSLQLLQQGLWLKAGLNVLVNVGLCLLATAAGIVLMQSVLNK